MMPGRHPGIPGPLALATRQRGDLGQPRHPALRRDGLPAVPPQDGARRHHGRHARTEPRCAAADPFPRKPARPRTRPFPLPRIHHELPRWFNCSPKTSRQADDHRGPPMPRPGCRPTFRRTSPVTMEAADPEGGRLLQRRRERAAPACARTRRASGSKRLSKFNELIAGVRKAVPDMLIQVGGSISLRTGNRRRRRQVVVRRHPPHAGRPRAASPTRSR